MVPSTKRSMEATDENVQGILADHREALVIYTDPDTEGESKISAFMKLEDKNGHLSAYLIRLLQQLLSDQDAKRGGIPNKAAIGS